MDTPVAARRQAAGRRLALAARSCWKVAVSTFPAGTGCGPMRIRRRFGHRWTGSPSLNWATRSPGNGDLGGIFWSCDYLNVHSQVLIVLGTVHQEHKTGEDVCESGEPDGPDGLLTEHFPVRSVRILRVSPRSVSNVLEFGTSYHLMLFWLIPIEHEPYDRGDDENDWEDVVNGSPSDVRRCLKQIPFHLRPTVLLNSPIRPMAAGSLLWQP